MNMKKTRILYEGDLKEKKGIEVNMPVGNVEVSPGHPHLLATTQNLDGHVEISDSENIQRITGNKCSLKITFAPTTDLGIKVDGGNVKVGGLSPKNFSVLLREGNLNLDLVNLEPKTSNISMDHGRIVGTLEFTSVKDFESTLNLLSGYANIKLVLPEDLGLKTVMESKFNGLLNLPKDIEGRKTLTFRIYAREGILRVSSKR